MADRIPVFELHIRPMFRVIDIDHMGQRGVDLTDYNTVKNTADEIIDWLKNSSPMPTASTGGPWPPEWIAVFERWTTHFHRLERNVGEDYRLRAVGDRAELSCTTSLPHFGAKSWLDLSGTRDGSRAYSLVLERAVPEPPSFPTPVTLREFFDLADLKTGVWVHDEAGEHFIEP